MKPAESQQFLRQQISHARLLLDRLDPEEAVTARRAVMQSVLLLLNTGLTRYFSAEFNQPNTLNLSQLIDYASSAGSALPENSAVQQEFITLMGVDYWLGEFSTVADSLAFLPKQWQSLHGAPSSNNLIATSSAPSSKQHWTQVDHKTVKSWVESVAELLERQTSASQEY